MSAPTWTNADTSTPWGLAAKGVAASGTANDAPTDSEGIALGHAQSMNVSIEADASQTLSGAGTLEAWFQEPQTSAWCRAKDFDITTNVSAVRRATFIGPSAGIGVPVIYRGGRFVWVPNGVTVSSGGLTIYINATQAAFAS
jgi:hypothetical protein